MTTLDSTDGERYETHEWAVEWPTFFTGTEHQSFATEAEARERCPDYGPSAYVTKINPVRVPVE